ncbi:metal-dependent hydrolase [Marinactinospora rubrisoli]|uniref:Metal-dependent hydrolase n=1 Tax=Marinactinospora rubrisoli TaxID=2715399 RepID=A0ABW2KCT9_9ACTN
MMGSSHAASGALAGAGAAALLAPAVSDGGLFDLAAGVLVGAGAALLPDLDHPQSTATRSQGPLTRLAHAGVARASRAVFLRTRTGADLGGHDRDGVHRHLSHTPLVALAVGAAVAVSGLWWPLLAAVLWFTVSLGLRGLGQCLGRGETRRTLRSWPAVSALAAGTAALLVWGGVSAPFTGVLVAAGMVVHVLGDALTRAGVPLLWPVVHRGRRWWMVRAPLTFATGDGWQERAVRWACLAGTVPVALLTLAA